MQIGLRIVALTIVALAGFSFFGPRPAIASEVPEASTQKAGAPIVLKNFTKARIARTKAAAKSKTSAKTSAKPAAKSPTKSALRPAAAKAATIRTTEAKRRAAKSTAVTRGAATAATAPDDDTAALPELPASVANANAELVPPAIPVSDKPASVWTQPPAPVTPGTATPPEQGLPSAATEELTASDQLNDLDLAASDPAAPTAVASPAPAEPVVTAALPDQPRQEPAKAEAVASSDHSAWGQTSLIGKIFLAFGGLLTLASAARMFMA
jgi:hypothetical protein